MSFRIAAASSDGVNVDLHFGHAESFYIYEVQSDGSYELVNVAAVPEKEEGGSRELIRVENRSAGGCSGGGCGSGGGCHTIASFSMNSDFLGGSRYVLAAKVGKGIEKALLKNGITAFSVELPIEQAIAKIAVYEKRLHKFNGGN